MRKWHRWLSVFFGIFLLWIAVTGVLSHVAAWWPSTPDAQSAAAAEPPPGFVCPEGWRCRPPRGDRSGIGSMVGLFHHLHSGSEFGPAGEAISFLSGVAMIFFAFSGVWLYVKMWLNRRRRRARPRWFWK